MRDEIHDETVLADLIIDANSARVWRVFREEQTKLRLHSGKRAQRQLVAANVVCVLRDHFRRLQRHLHLGTRRSFATEVDVEQSLQ